MVIAILLVLVLLLGVTIGGIMGRFMERKDWDQLIRDGKLPRPDQRWKAVDQEYFEK